MQLMWFSSDWVEKKTIFASHFLHLTDSLSLKLEAFCGFFFSVDLHSRLAVDKFLLLFERFVQSSSTSSSGSESVSQSASLSTFTYSICAPLSSVKIRLLPFVCGMQPPITKKPSMIIGGEIKIEGMKIKLWYHPQIPWHKIPNVCELKFVL